MIDEPFSVMVRRCERVFGMKRWQAEDHVRQFEQQREAMRARAARPKEPKKGVRPWEVLAFRPDLKERLRAG